MPTYTFTSITADGRIQSDGSTYAIARNGTGTFAVDTTGAAAGDVGQQEFFGFRLWEFFVGWDTSSIPDTETVTSATISLYPSGGTADSSYTIEVRLLDWGGTVTSADFVAGGSLSALPLLASKSVTSGSPLPTNQYADFTSDANLISNINLTGTTYVIVCSSQTTNNTAPATGKTSTTNFYTADDPGTTRDPKLVVVTADVALPDLVTAPMLSP